MIAWISDSDYIPAITLQIVFDIRLVIDRSRRSATTTAGHAHTRLKPAAQVSHTVKVVTLMLF